MFGTCAFFIARLDEICLFCQANFFENKYNHVYKFVIHNTLLIQSTHLRKFCLKSSHWIFTELNSRWFSGSNFGERKLWKTLEPFFCWFHFQESSDRGPQKHYPTTALFSSEIFSQKKILTISPPSVSLRGVSRVSNTMTSEFVKHQTLSFWNLSNTKYYNTFSYGFVLLLNYLGEGRCLLYVEQKMLLSSLVK